MDTTELEYDLPAESIAQRPLARRDASRLLHLDRTRGSLAHYGFADLPRLLNSGDVLVRNVTRVLPARLCGLRRASGGAVEALFLSPVDEVRWEALLSPSRRLKPGERLTLDGTDIVFELRRLDAGGRGVLATSDQRPIRELLEDHGETPLPPYIRRPADTTDTERYQTVYASRSGSVAAPTAGLHLTDELLAVLAERGLEVLDLSLEIGLGTFQPVRHARLEDHAMHSETYEVPDATALAVEQALKQRRRVIPVGTTSLRALESAWNSGRLKSGPSRSELFIRPGYRFSVSGALLTNFHAPRSTLLALVMAFAGVEPIRAAYREALAEGYRFLSYGDAMLIT